MLISSRPCPPPRPPGLGRAHARGPTLRLALLLAVVMALGAHATAWADDPPAVPSLADLPAEAAPDTNGAPLPSTLGLTRGEAEQLLPGYPLQLEVTLAAPEMQGRVIEQVPEPGHTWAAGQTVTLVFGVSEEPGLDYRQVPQLEGLTLADAQLRLARAGFTLAASTVPSREDLVGLVITTTPQRFSFLLKGEAVRVRVGRGSGETPAAPAPEPVTAPPTAPESPTEDPLGTAVPGTGTPAPATPAIELPPSGPLPVPPTAPAPDLAPAPPAEAPPSLPAGEPPQPATAAEPAPVPAGESPAPGAGAPACPPPTLPGPPPWDPSRDVKVRLGPDGRPLQIASVDPLAPVPSGVKPLPGAQPAAAPPEPPTAPAPAPGPAAIPTEPLTGSPDDPWLPGATAPPASAPVGPPSGAVPAGPVPLPPPPTAPVEDDPWLPGAGAGRPAAAPPLAERPPALPAAPPTTVPPRAPSPSAPPTPAPPDDPWLPGSASGPTPAPPTVAPPSVPDAPPPTGMEPLPAPPAGEAPLPLPPAGSGEPVFSPPAAPTPSVVPAEPPAPIPTPENPAGFEFTPPDARRAQTHADQLRANPADATLHGYPTDLVKRARAEIALEPGTRPALILFYDDSARSSNLQAAELLPLLVRVQAGVDVIPIDVAAASALTPAEKKLVRTYYMAYVPTTVVLGANRKPVLLQYQRVSAAVVEAALRAPPR